LADRQPRKQAEFLEKAEFCPCRDLARDCRLQSLAPSLFVESKPISEAASIFRSRMAYDADEFTLLDFEIDILQRGSERAARIRIASEKLRSERCFLFAKSGDWETVSFDELPCAV